MFKKYQVFSLQMKNHSRIKSASQRFPSFYGFYDFLIAFKPFFPYSSQISDPMLGRFNRQVFFFHAKWNIQKIIVVTVFFCICSLSLLGRPAKPSVVKLNLAKLHLNPHVVTFVLHNQTWKLTSSSQSLETRVSEHKNLFVQIVSLRWSLLAIKNVFTQMTSLF